ncbi:GlxA family transcriptional regulator [Nocardia sp. JMUB6875]|uniref:GlxA family transcriptional regulator n=1 Tax=Nocardia sp. JMUB6875 TaxID=3158170 RepID=UPI0032E7BA1D
MAGRDVLVVLFDEVTNLEVAGPLQVFVTANTYVPEAYTIHTASVDGEPVKTCGGLTLVPDTALADAPPAHTLVVPGGVGARPPRQDPRLVSWLRDHAASAPRIMSICTGSFLLAEAGHLDGQRATTHWSMCEMFAEQYPGVRVDSEPVYVRTGNVATSAGVTAGIDLALAMIEQDLGRDIALKVAKHLVLFLCRSGSQPQLSVQLGTQIAARHRLRELQFWISENPGADLSVDALATRVTMSTRHFARAFKEEIGVSPGSYVDRTRLETARRLLEETTDGINEISRRCGYGTPEAMRRAFIRTVAVSPSEYRRRLRDSTSPEAQDHSGTHRTSPST